MGKEQDFLINTSDYSIVNKKTGEVVEMDVIVKYCKKTGWQKIYAKELSKMFSCGGGVAKVICYILEKKNVDNILIGTYSQIAKKVGVSDRTVLTTIKELKNGGFIKKIAPSCYMLDPRIMRYGSEGKGVALLTIWRESK